MNFNNSLKKIEYLSPPNIILIGNGINRAFGSGKIHWFEPNLNRDENFAKLVWTQTNGVVCHTEDVGKRGFKEYYSHIAERIKQTMYKAE